jgi:hypothetical protein
MARGRAKKGRRLSEISETIVAEWFRVLPETEGDTIERMDAFSLTAAFNDILEKAKDVDGNTLDWQAVPDEPKKPFKIIVPLPPAKSKQGLVDYLEKNGDFIDGMGVAVLFGCGR